MKYMTVLHRRRESEVSQGDMCSAHLLGVPDSLTFCWFPDFGFISGRQFTRRTRSV